MSEIRAIEVPKWGLSMEEGTLTSWLIEEGAAFAEQQEVCEIETSKIANVLQVPFAGVLRRKVAQPGDTIAVGGVLGVVAEASVGEAEIDAYLAQRGSASAVADAAPSAPGAPPSTAPEANAACADAQAGKQAQGNDPSRPAPDAAQAQSTSAPADADWQIPQTLRGVSAEDTFATPHALKLAAELGLDLGQVPGSGRGARISVADIEAAVRAAGGQVACRAPVHKATQPAASRADDSQVAATPLARRLAQQWGINLHDCRATGSRGRVCKADVQAQRSIASPSPSSAEQPASAPAAFDTLPMNGMRKAIAARLQASKREAPHFRLHADFDLERLLALRSEINAAVPAVKLSVNDLLIKACAQALVEVPGVNVQYDAERQEIRRYADADIAVAVALDGGLITPIVRQANRKRLAEVSAEMLALATQAKAGTLKPEQFQGGTFSLSNLGMLGVRRFDAIINPPQGAILAIGAGEQRVVVHEGQPAVRMQMSVTLSCDHRVIDGALGAAFLKALKQRVENPTLMLV
ncbi:2-oxo acid dehydrogenase subunit E2 [Pseudomonas sp. MLB6B]